MTRIIAMAHNTFREAVRDKILYVLLFFAVVAVFGSKALGWISIGQDIKIVKDICLAAISIFGALIAIFIGTSLLYKEIEKRTLYTILAQPIHRYEFVLGKYFGLAALLGLTTLAMTLLSAGYILLLGGALNLVFFQAALLIYLKLLLITALAVLLSAATSPILGAIIVFCAYVFGHATGIFINLPPQLAGTTAAYLLKAAYYIIPNLDNFNIQSAAANDMPVAGPYIIWAIFYGIGYSAVFVTLACVAFEEKDV